jgi:hypothetical protein
MDDLDARLLLVLQTTLLTAATIAAITAVEEVQKAAHRARMAAIEAWGIERRRVHDDYLAGRCTFEDVQRVWRNSDEA